MMKFKRCYNLLHLVRKYVGVNHYLFSFFLSSSSLFDSVSVLILQTGGVFIDRKNEFDRSAVFPLLHQAFVGHVHVLRVVL